MSSNINPTTRKVQTESDYTDDGSRTAAALGCAYVAAYILSDYTNNKFIKRAVRIPLVVGAALGGIILTNVILDNIKYNATERPRSVCSIRRDD